jgi:hypothetical protein
MKIRPLWFLCLLAGLLLPWPLGGALSSAHAGDGERYAVELGPGAAGSKLAPRFRPAASKLRLRAPEKPPLLGHDHLQAEVPLGPEGEAKRTLLLWRSAPDKAHDVLLFDANGNGDLSDDRRVRAQVQEGKGAIWLTFDVSLRVDHGTAETPLWQEYQLGFWIVVPSVEATPETLFAAGDGYRAGRLMIGENEYDVILSDANNDGAFHTGDYWTLRDVLEDGTYEFHDARTVGDFAWAGGRAWKLELDDSTGRSAHLVSFSPGLSQTEDEKRRDPCYVDRRAPRAEIPLPVERDFDAGTKKAREQIAPLFLFFAAAQDLEAQNMESLVFVQKAIVESARGLVTIFVDVDQRSDLVSRHDVQGRLAGILLDPAGEELARFRGYQSGEALEAFLTLANAWLLPSDDEPLLKGKARKRHAKEVKAIYDYLEGKKQPGLLVDRIRDVGSRGTRGARDALIRFAIKRKSKEYVAAAFSALADIGGLIAIEFVCGKDALGSGDFLVAESAANALAEAKDPQATTPILGVMLNKRTKVEIIFACALALAQSDPKDPRVIDTLFEFSEHKKDTARAGAVEALGYIATDEAVARLKEVLLHEKNTRVRAAAATGFGHTKRPEFIPFLRSAIENDNAHTVKTEGLAAIQKLQGGG